MNFTGSNSITHYGKRINWQAVSLAGGLAVALAAAALAGAFEREPTTRITTAPARPAVEQTTTGAGFVAASQPAGAIVYVVESEADKRVFEMANEATLLEGMGGYTPPFVVLASPAQDAIYSEVVAQQANGTTVTIVDARATGAASTDPQAAGHGKTVLYVVSSWEDAIAMQEALFESGRLEGVSGIADKVFVMDSTQRESDYRERIMQLMESSVLQIVDLR